MDMMKALVPVEMTLASNVALRYLCQKAGLLGIGVQPIHVEEPDHKPHSSETGWIRKSWESGLRQAGMEEVQRVLKSEKLDCFVLPNPIVRVGSREDRILEELRMGGHDLFVEGEVVNFNTGEFRKRLRSKLYRQMPCPALIVRNMIQSDRVALMLDEKTDVEYLVAQFCKFFTDTGTDFDLCAYAMDDLHRDPHPDELLAEAGRILEKRGYAPAMAYTLLCGPDSASQALHDYGLLVAHMDRKSNRKSPLTEVLGLVSSPILLCW
ncbi:universal stress protein [Pseudodesulfovibrio cashew]|uniref:Universal stress protein n=1 Tax=Pseudodesulfovibrio cashew TaxID=2678688 RepID=A0A6I6JPC7_9BACT|nr:universal stress protein [Pseudodesulfovibrio cashew]QGY39474.1 universal stress protein [Pseudodesulfovibrio cashew]